MWCVASESKLEMLFIKGTALAVNQLVTCMTDNLVTSWP